MNEWFKPTDSKHDKIEQNKSFDIMELNKEWIERLYEIVGDSKKSLAELKDLYNLGSKPPVDLDEKSFQEIKNLLSGKSIIR